MCESYICCEYVRAQACVCEYGECMYVSVGISGEVCVCVLKYVRMWGVPVKLYECFLSVHARVSM